MMKTSVLYTALVASVLMLAACGGSESGSAASETGDGDVNNQTVTSTSQAAAEMQAADDSAKVVLFLGNSLAAGYGLDPEQAFPALIQDRIDSLGWNFRVVNAGVSGETTAGGLSRIDWLLERPVDILVLELGGNDGLRGINLDATRENLQAIIDQTRAAYPDVRILLAGMQIPPNLGLDYTEGFRELYPDLAEANDIDLIPFLLEGVGGVPSLNLPDGIHPTAEGHEIVADNVWAELEPILIEVDPSCLDLMAGEHAGDVECSL